MRCALRAGLVAVVLGSSLGDAGAQTTEPADVGVRERVEVQLVLVDFTVVDRAGRTVSGLGPDDFWLRAGGRDVPIATLDEQCPDGAAEDPYGAKHEDYVALAKDAKDAEDAAEADRSPLRRIVLVFDYFHMQWVPETLRQARDALRQRHLGGEEHMVVTLGQALRVESPFTADVDATEAAIERMLNDRELYAGPHAGLTEFRFFRRLRALFDLLERTPGRKVIVLYSGPFAPAGWTHDEQFRELASIAARSRTAIYTMDTGGLRDLLDPHKTSLGGPPMLRRLAVETGGRATADTNDITMAYARAQRDLRCSYTLGFYDSRAREGRDRRLHIRPRRDGLRAIYPNSYVLRSPEEKREALLEAATMLPEMFSSEGIRARLTLRRPGARRWQADVTVALADETAGAQWEIRGGLRKPNGTVVQPFRLRAASARGEAPSLTEQVALAPGRYRLFAVASTAGRAEPRAVVVDIEIPELPRTAAGER